MEIPFDEGARSVTFNLKYPEHSQFVAVVSDASGFGTGGTSVPARVGESDDDSCYDPNVGSQVDFAIDFEPRNQITQCGVTRIFWPRKDQVQGPTQFYGVIPGGQSFEIPQGEVTDEIGFGTGFDWRANVRVGTTLMIVGGDSRRTGNGGSGTFLVANPPEPDDSCLDANSPSSTPGTPAGGTYPTGTGGNSGDSTDNVDGGGSNVGAIVGGVVGGLVVLVSLVLIIFFYRRRRKVRSRQREKPVDLLNEGEDDEEGDGGNQRESRNDLPQFYRPEPFTVPDPTLASTYGDGDDRGSTRPLSGTATSFYTRSATPDGSVALGYGVGAGAPSSIGTGRKGQPPRAMRPVNIIQHDDAGPSVPYLPKEDEEAETIELPPAYTAIRSEHSIPAPQSTNGTSPATPPAASSSNPPPPPPPQ
ncbi:hypothetical protein CC1G_10705 [Coprinopsis cinerea okayama7|uniref:receptor protein-tyrosine kinase n=1 Tax=Coprinopsis cinerea (strain Okayama-7 / 130 / ATCC MYA-4618 / FGSC 9003) TaxID=240176 RepID=A8NBC4_COPC7|nr:hypothetical protein CC1G_10705 [Coprinopsis cinerea okayama7\|eukprot:XP_001832123.1 hypothetical protein CC1G_10705 [Coprinopsis cinerea okayama7\